MKGMMKVMFSKVMNQYPKSQDEENSISGSWIEGLEHSLMFYTSHDW
jgi:hypothetical protein